MPPFCVGAIRQARVRIASGMSKCARPSSSTAVSDLSCIHSRSASVPASRRDGSASRISAASSGVAPGRIRSAVVRRSASSRASSSWPHAYVSSRSMTDPMNERENAAYRSRPTTSRSGATGRSSSRRTSSSSVYAAQALVGAVGQVAPQVGGYAVGSRR